MNQLKRKLQTAQLNTEKGELLQRHGFKYEDDGYAHKRLDRFISDSLIERLSIQTLQNWLDTNCKEPAYTLIKMEINLWK